MFSTSISPTKLKIKDSLIAIVFITLFIVLLPVVLITIVSLTLITLGVFKYRTAQIKRSSSLLIHAVKGRDYTVK